MDVQQTPYGQVSTSSGVSPDNHEVEAPRKLAFAVSGLTERQQIALAMRQSSASDATPNERAGAAAAAAAAAGAMLRVKNATTLPSSHQKATPKPKHALRAKEVNPVAVRIDVAVAEGDVDGADASSSSSSPSTTTASSGHTFEGEGVYCGEMKSGKRHGAGRMEWNVGIWAGETYDGQWRDDLMHGNGQLCKKNGDTYTGHFSKNLLHGHGRFEWAALGTVYEGGWKNDKRHGLGTFQWTSAAKRTKATKGSKSSARQRNQPGDYYCGFWEGNVRHGWGFYYYREREEDAKKPKSKAARAKAAQAAAAAAAAKESAPTKAKAKKETKAEYSIALLLFKHNALRKEFYGLRGDAGVRGRVKLLEEDEDWPIARGQARQLLEAIVWERVPPLVAGDRVFGRVYDGARFEEAPEVVSAVEQESLRSTSATKAKKKKSSAQKRRASPQQRSSLKSPPTSAAQPRAKRARALVKPSHSGGSGRGTAATASASASLVVAAEPMHSERQQRRRPRPPPRVRARPDARWLAPLATDRLSLCTPHPQQEQQRRSVSLETAELVRCLALLRQLPRHEQA